MELLLTCLKAEINYLIEELKMDKDAVIVPISATSRDGKYEVWEIINALFETNGFDIVIERQIPDL